MQMVETRPLNLRGNNSAMVDRNSKLSEIAFDWGNKKNDWIKHGMGLTSVLDHSWRRVGYHSKEIPEKIDNQRTRNISFVQNVDVYGFAIWGSHVQKTWDNTKFIGSCY